MKQRYYLLFLFAICFMLSIASCEKTIDVHPIYQIAFKPLESTTFYMVCDSLNDTIKYDTQPFIYSYEKKGLYSSTELQTISLYATIEGDLNKVHLLNMDLNPYGNEVDLLSIVMKFKITNADLTCQNNTNCFLDSFNNDFEINGLTYKQCFSFNYLNSIGILTTALIYSPSVGVLRLISNSNGAIYNRCFECE